MTTFGATLHNDDNGMAVQPTKEKIRSYKSNYHEISNTSSVILNDVKTIDPHVIIVVAITRAFCKRNYSGAHHCIYASYIVMP